MRYLRSVLYLLLAFYLSGCNQAKKSGELKQGNWRGIIKIQGEDLPFNFEISGKIPPNITLINSEERLDSDSVKIFEDSIFIPMHLFDTEIRAKIEGNSLKGLFIKNYLKDYKLPFQAEYGKEYRFIKNPKASRQLSKKYKLHFSNDPDSVYAVALFNHKANKVTGTILTITGDHRFLDGQVDKDSLFLSAFDGEHAYLYKAKINADQSLSGKHWSGKSYNATFKATSNDTIKLPNANNLTFIKPGYDKLAFSFPGLSREMISLNDSKYQNKVVIIQLLGSWCPNCMDETRFLSPWYEKNRNKGVEIIGLAYEKKDDLEYAQSRVEKMKKRLNIKYDLAIAGTSDKEMASKTLPMINAVLAFPTTIFIDKKGNVRKIHTGFSGPGTGKYYEEFVEEFNETINQLLKE